MTDPITIGAVTVAVTLAGAIYRINVLHKRELDRLRSNAASEATTIAEMKAAIDRNDEDISRVRKAFKEDLGELKEDMNKIFSLISEVQQRLARIESAIERNGKH